MELGDIVKDTITGFTGVLVAKTNWLHGCERLTIQPQELKDGKRTDSDTFDRLQCALVKRGAFSSSSRTGGPRPEPRRQSDPR